MNKLLSIRFLLICIAGIPMVSRAQSLQDLTSKQVKIGHERFLQYDGTIEVPENRNLAGSRILKLPVRIFKSTGSGKKEAVFYLDGGPGNTNISGTSNAALLHEHDLVFVGYRGVDGSTVLNAKTLGRAMTGLKHPLLGDASLDTITSVLKSYFGKLDQQGIDISNYTMTEVIDDMEAVRKALGYQQIHLLSFSYGTRLALVYCMRYPESVSRVVLAGANPPGHFYWFPEKTEEILHRWDSIYTAAGNESLVATIQQVLNRMPEKWACYRLDKDKIKCGTFLALSQNNLAVMVFDAFYRALEKKDYSGIYMISLLFDMAMKNVTWGDMYSKGASADQQENMPYRENLRRADTTTVLGPNLSLLLWGTIRAWNAGLIPEEYRRMQVISAETLVVSGDLDVPTPADYARDELMPFLPSGKQVILKNTGHGDLQTAQPEAYNHMISHFFNTGQVDTTQFTSKEVVLAPSKKLYRIARVGFPLVVVMGWLY